MFFVIYISIITCTIKNKNYSKNLSRIKELDNEIKSLKSQIENQKYKRDIAKSEYDSEVYRSVNRFNEHEYSGIQTKIEQLKKKYNEELGVFNNLNDQLRHKNEEHQRLSNLY